MAHCCVELARISHQFFATAGEAPHPAVFSHLGVLDVLSSTTPRPSDRKPHWAQHLATLATKPGEICGLVLEDSGRALRHGLQRMRCAHPWIALVKSRMCGVFLMMRGDLASTVEHPNGNRRRRLRHVAGRSSEVVRFSGQGQQSSDWAPRI